eukprot:CAMPEP_0168614932 /NCGR_PEP_ID=MMETSP0449_2-20121227/4239_1 /TAXON_ID=1082188 /ORGANISM="Strombidium rassoulzadegani, Strain ras09" /LENGTH=32 /DNA_ID= /DNA_START= /DNA_END= /DNA_ORIENTATION=
MPSICEDFKYEQFPGGDRPREFEYKSNELTRV